MNNIEKIKINLIFLHNFIDLINNFKLHLNFYQKKINFIYNKKYKKRGK